ncbi:MAG: hypothetical protein EAZ85_11895 [Bacteroidetes bacterium]|nr:MAG: hypothetical protein EAZ85_11895 [Bacteroidota bacterium]TAG93084.1 MAG: hypothetical protein EAZ20_01955 [Bacteroidota bacterium]
MNTFKKPLFIHWFYYISAIISYSIAFILLSVHYYQQNIAIPFLCYVLLGLCIVYPHFVFWIQYLKTGFNERHERYCMLLDAGISGIFGNFIAIFSAPSLLFFMLTMTNIMLGHGLRVFLLGFVLSIFNLFLVVYWVGFHFFEPVSFELSAISGVFTLLYPIYLAYIVHFRTNSLKNSKIKLKTQKAEMQELNEELNQLNEELSTTIDTISEQKEKIESQNEDIIQSINYAKRIQEAVMHPVSYIQEVIPESFILYKPRDVVSGDFYFITEHNQKIFIAAVDCTGHGIPGAFMSFLGNDLMTEIIINRNIQEADIILNKMNKGIRKILRQEETKNRDGMDIALVVIDNNKKIVEFAGAKNPLIYIQNEQLFYIKGDNKHIGGEQKEEKIFTKHQISIQNTTTFYIFSDGFQDQFGGQENRKFMINRLKQTLLSIHQKPFKEQQNQLDVIIEDWKREGRENQTDDILLIGFKV